ncbi:MAG: glycosyltransferase [Bacteroidetes bacterium]|nr:glycosyltransferase [Bacteroidota bacterium]
MRIAFITSHINRSTQWNWFSEELLERKIPHIHIIINEKYPILADDLKKLGVTVYYLPHKGLLNHFVNLFKTMYYLKKHKINLVHTEMPMGNLIGQIAALLCLIKMRVTTVENTTWAFDFNSKKQYYIDKITFRLAKKIIALTNEARTFLLNVFKVDERKLTHIHHSLKQSDYLHIDKSRTEKLRKELEIDDDIFIIEWLPALNIGKVTSMR